MNKNEVFAHFSSILDNMLDNSYFFDTYFQAPYFLEDVHGSRNNKSFPEHLHIFCGATRGCIFDENYDYVVKFDISHDAFGSACEREEYIYNVATRAGLNQYFAEVQYLGTYVKTIYFYSSSTIARNMTWYDLDPDFETNFILNRNKFGCRHEITISLPLYAYPKASSHKYNFFSERNEIEYKEKAKKITSPMRDRNLAIAMDFIYEYGEEAYQELTDFMYEYNINDLHTGNLADINGHYCIIDYAGFHSSSYERSNSYYA